MLESLVASILNKTLGAYVENFDPNQLNIGIWSGDVTLKNLKLKSESLDKLNLPINLNCGHLGTLTMQIPWSNLKSKPVKILIENCFILASAKLPSNFNLKEELEKKLNAKRQKLKDLEIISENNEIIDDLNPNNNNNNKSQSTFTESLISKIIDNLQITIKNIHIRYEDFDCYTKLPYSFGITLDELSAVSTDENWVTNFIENISNMSRKLMLLKSLTIYLDTSINKSTSLVSNDKDKMLQNLKDYIQLASNNNSQNVEYILQPVSGKGHLTLNKLGPTENSPHYDLKLFFDQFRINLNRLQYTNILDTTTEMNYFMKTSKFKINAPKCSINEDPLKWLQYSFQTVYNEIHDKNYKKTWDYLKIRRDQRKAYIKLWKKYLLDKKSLTIEENTELKKLEDDCEFDDLRFYRSLAKIQFKKEHKIIPSSSGSNSTTNTNNNQNKGWFSSWWGSSNENTESNSNSENTNNIQITNEQINEFYDAIEFDESKVLSDSIDIPRERVKFSINCKLHKGSFIIRSDKNSKNLAEFISQGCQMDFLQRKDSYFVSFNLLKLLVEDGSSNTLYKHIVNVKEIITDNKPNNNDYIDHSMEIDDDNDSNETQCINIDLENDKIEKPFFHLSYEQNPLSKIADSELIVKLSSMTIFHNTNFIESIYEFFKPPTAHKDTIGSIMNAAESTIQDFTKQTKIGLQYAFEEHKTMNCQMDLQAPLIILPLDPTKWDSPIGILDAGHISIASELISPSKYEEIKNENKENYTSNDWNRLNSFMYDKYNILLEDAQILIGPNIKSTIDQLHTSGPKPSLILDQLNVNFLIELSIIPSFYDLPKMRVKADVPRFIAMLNDYQYKIFLDLLDSSIPNFDKDTNSANITTANKNGTANVNDSSDDDKDVFSDAYAFLPSNNDNKNEINYEPPGSETTSIVDDSNMTTSIDTLSPALNQKSIVFDFTMDLMVVSLKRCSNTTTFESEKLVDLVGEKLQLSLFSTERELHVNLLLADLSVKDHIESSNVKEFKKLVGSRSRSKNRSKSKSNDDAKSDNLFVVNYTRTRRLALFKGETIECFDQDIKLDISDFQVVITRKTLLTLLNYSLNTFTDPLAPELPSDKLRHNEEETVNSPVHINVDINMQSIHMILNDDGIKLATLVLDKADVGLFILTDSMKVNAKIGGLTLIDNDNYNGRKLISIQGDDLADLYYETFDPETNTLPYSSQFKFETRSMVVMFVEDSFSRIYQFICQFQRMKYIYDTAREAALNQASNVEYSNTLKFDVLIRAPIFVFPKSVDPVNNLFDTITVNLGEIHTSNDFIKTETNDEYFNLISAGLSNTKILSSFVVNGSEKQNLEIIDKLDINFDINYYEGDKIKRPSIIVNGDLLGNDIKLTEFQTFSFIQIFQSFPRIFNNVDIDDTDVEEIELEADNANKMIAVTKSSESNKTDEAPTTQQSDESTIGYNANDETYVNSNSETTDEVMEEEVPKKVTVDLSFNVPTLGLSLFNDTCHIVDISDKKLSQFTMTELGIKFQLFDNGDFKSDSHIKSFVVKDVRSGSTNVFKDIIPEAIHSNYQFMSNIQSINGVTDIDVAIDSPQLILALDYLFSIKSFVDFAIQQPKLVVDDYMKHHQTIDENLEDEYKSIAEINKKKDDEENSVPSETKTNYKINIVDPSVVLLANPEKEDSDAVIFKVSQLLLNLGDITEIKAVGIGMFLQKMSSEMNNKLRILDDFSFNLNIDPRGSNATSFLTTIDSTIQPLLLRLSLRDIYLALHIFNKASVMYKEQTDLLESEGIENPLNDISKKISKYAPSIISSISKLSHQRRKSRNIQPVMIIKAEKLKIKIEGFRMVLIGDVHELPILDFDVKPFELNARNWSTELEADTQINSLINIFNYSLSQWEPLLDPWYFAVHAERSTDDKLSVNFVSRKNAEFTITSRSIATISHFVNLLSEQGELKERGEDSPFRIINQTGHDIKIWIDDADDAEDENEDKSNRRQETLIKNLETVPWSFEDWAVVRQSLAINTNIHFIGVQILDTKYRPLRMLSLRTEGDNVAMLEPELDEGYHNRLSYEITLAEDKVKEVVIKSTISIENFTPTAIHVGIGNDQGQLAIDREIVIPPGGKLALPIDFVYNGRLAVRPSTTSEIFGWSAARLVGDDSLTDFKWETIRDNDILLECSRAEADGVADFYYFKAHAVYDKDDVLNQLYPHMNIMISPPLVLENLLPFDIEWRLFQKGPTKWNDVLKQGETCPIHVVDMNFSAVLKILILGSKYAVSGASIINTPNSISTVDREINLKSSDGQRLSLKLCYSYDPKYGTKVSIYSPYIFVNRTERDLYIIDNFNTLVSKKRTIEEVNEAEYPDMFSFGIEDEAFGIFKGSLKNTVQLKLEDSYPSDGFSIDKIGQSFEVRVGLKTKNHESDIGIHITEGKGIYKLSKVIIVTPRYVIRNDLQLPVVIGYVTGENKITVDSQSISPIFEIPTYGDKQLQVGFKEGKESMSAPFIVNNVGEIYLRVKKIDSNAHMLLRVVINTENATIFINIVDAQNMWPYSLRNFSDQEFFVYQADPYIDKDGNKTSDRRFEPVFYKIPPKSVMPYAWDFPAAEVKELILRCGKRERYIQLAEIGSLMPMRVKKEDGTSKIFDLNVIADGPIQALMISEYDPKTSMYQIKKSHSSVSLLNGIDAKDEFETSYKDENYYTSLLFDFEGIGISLVNTDKENTRELCYLTIKGIEFHYNESDIYQNASLKMKWLQLDNQLYSSMFPVVMYPTVVPKTSNELNSHPLFSTSVARLKDSTHGVNYIKFATVLLQELTIQVDENFLWEMLDFSKIPGAAWNSQVENILWDKNLQIPEPPTIRTTDDLYFELLHLQPLQFNISFVCSDRSYNDDQKNTQNNLSIAADILTMAIGNINNAPVRLSALMLENIRTPIPYLFQNISEHYKQAFLYQIYKVLGSADVLGNPVGLFNNISSGVMDIFYEPYQGYIMTDKPQELGIGLAKGGLSFFKKSVFGVSDSVSRITDSVAKGLTVASMDKDFQERRRLNRQANNKTNRPVDGIQAGAQSLFTGISSGITGLAMAPMEGATREGASGFFKGLGKGILGLPTKTATGVLDMANNISETIKSTTTAFEGKGTESMRLPRYIPYDGSMVRYDKKESQGQYWLKTVNNGEFSRDKYLAHLKLQEGGKVCVVSYSRILMVKIYEMELEWQIKYEDIEDVLLDKQGIKIKYNSNKLGRIDIKEMFIPEREDRRFLYKKIAIAVNEYNNHCIMSL
ncbi:membrane morphogenesis protein [Pichia kluyveri]|uniref:Membrane morphogenesis protein n=1 Tax=Pichia kluyveri TaxID=36015 RepID=A0AAV5R627_PICKL|nr:membrane morphogenesis protein [Pichia kluyveri]